MLKLITGIVVSSIIQLNGVGILPPLLPNFVQQLPSKEMQIELTEGTLREQVIKFGLAGDHQNMCASLDALGEFYDLHSRFAEAEFCYLGALKSIRTHFGESSAETAYAYSRLSGHYVTTHEYDRALRANSKAIKILTVAKNANLFKLGIMHHNQGWLESGHSSFRLAEQHYKHSIMLLKESIGAEHLLVGLTLNNLGNVYLVQNKFAEAERSFAQAYKILPTHGASDATLRRLFRNYADVLHKLGKHKQAEEVMSRIQDLLN
jgi:tetratricopeptide (TPR) repeat protein